MRRFLVTACALCLALGVLALADNGSHLGWICTTSPIDPNIGGDMNLKAATAAPYQPGTISTTYRVPMEGYTGFVVRAKYARGETITTAAVVRLWGVKGSNYIALAAPGVDIFLPAPDGKYQMTSGTSFSAAYVSGVAALLLERNFTLKPEALRATLSKTARDLGSPGRDEQFGDGEADAYAAVMAVPLDGATPLAAASGTTKREDSPERREEQGTRALEQESPSMAADKSTVSQADRSASR